MQLYFQYITNKDVQDNHLDTNRCVYIEPVFKIKHRN